MKTAPPIEPGIPDANSIPVSPAFAALLATVESKAPASTTTVSPLIVMSFDCLPREITTPSIPSSDTSKLLPFPITINGISCSLRN